MRQSGDESADRGEEGTDQVEDRAKDVLKEREDGVED